MARPAGFFGAIAPPSSRLELLLQRADRHRGVHRLVLDTAQAAICGAFSGASPGCIAWVAGHLVGTAQAARSAYERWGTQGFARLDGNFCLAIYDAELRGFRIAADLAGTKPLFYCVASGEEGDEALVFGSSATEVLRAAAIPAVAHAPSLERYLGRGALAGFSETLFQGVSALRRNHYLEVLAGSPMRIRQVAFPEEAAQAIGVASLDDRASELRSVLLRTVDAQAGAGNTAVALSGGIDSSGLLAGLRSARGPGEALSAFTYSQQTPAPPEAWDERPWAQRAAAHTNATLHTVELEAGELPEAFRSVVAAQDFPFSSPVILAQAKLFRCAAEKGVEVLLSGHGPDILFGGSDAQLVLRLSGMLRGGRWFAAARMLPGAAAHANVGAPRLLAAGLRRALRGGVPRSPGSRPVAWASHRWFDERGAPAHEEEAGDIAGLEPMQAFIHEQLGCSLGSTSLLYEENNASVQGLDNRLPYLVAAMLGVSRSCSPEHLVSAEGQTKHVLRRALAGMLPQEILTRSRRIGFAVPALPWLHQQRTWVEGLYGELGSLPFFRGPSARDLWRQLDAQGPAAWSCAFRLWRWIGLLEWSRAHRVRFE
jgi:asparagine synthase (glutamine-hydrolysing)